MGTCVEQHAPFVCKWHFSMVAALALDEGIVAAKVIEGSFDREWFMEYLRDDVVNSLFFISCYHTLTELTASYVNSVPWSTKRPYYG